MWRKNTCIILLIGFLLPGPGHAAASTSERINGVAQFLLDRAQENYLHIFEERIRANSTFYCYFPNTYRNLEYAGLKELLLSTDLWERSIRMDLDTLLTRATAQSIERTFSVSAGAVSIWERYIPLLQKLEIQYEGKRYPLTVLPPDRDAEVVELINRFWMDLVYVSDALNYFRRFGEGEFCELPVVGHEEFRRNVQTLLEMDERVDRALNAFDTEGKRYSLHVKERADIEMEIDGNMRTGVLAVKKQLMRFKAEADGLVDKDAVKEIQQLRDLIQIFRAPREEIPVAEKVIRALEHLEREGKIAVGDLERVRRHILFFAQVADAESAEQVNETLKAYTVPAVSFFEKRREGDHWMIQSYLGAAAGSSDVPRGEEESNEVGIYAPIGLEYSLALHSGGSVGILLAPVDFGYPVTLKLSGIDEDVDFDEIVAPSIGLTYGFEDYPIGVGLAYQRGRSFRDQSESEERLLLHVSFDMPLLMLK